MSKVIPKEQLTAYQRWELAAFDEPGQAQQPPRQAPEPEPVAAQSSEPQVVLPTAQEIETLHQEAWQEGYQLGMAEGHKEGHAAGLAAGQEAGEQYVRELRALVAALEGGQLRQDHEVAREVLELSLVMARQVLRSALQIKPELILDAIREALKTLPTLNGHHKIITHPDSAQVVRDWLAHEHGHLSWKIIEDAQMEPGDFRLESAYSELDGSIRARWLELTRCLGADDAWLI
jgi:flagellar assembly protein FliH